MADFLILVGLAGLITGVVAVAKGSLPKLHLAGRKHAGLLIAASFVAVMAGGALAYPATDTDSSPKTEKTASPAEAEASASPTAAEPELVLSLPPEPLSADQPPPAPAPAAGLTGAIPAGAQPAKVARHVDGDTIWAEGGTLPPGAVSRIRLLQVDTPESTNRTDCYGPEASAFTRAELPVGSRIHLLADKEDKDRYGRFLRYIWKENGEFFNEKLARQGYARAVIYMPNDRYIGVIRAAEAEAKAAGRGLWSACAGTAPPAAPPAPPPRPAPPPAAPAPQQVAPPAAGGNCDPSYPRCLHRSLPAGSRLR